ncbi:MAG: molybdopterin-dependent oxidoreductase [Steroidobacteraceae bacterium]
MAEAITYCRNCAANCGLVLEVEADRIVSIRPDRQNPVSEGYACIKGTMAAHLHNGDEDRLTQCMKRDADGQFRPIDKYQAVEEIAGRLRGILDRHGPRALAAFFGTTSYADCVGKPFLKSLMAALGSPAIFSSMTVDQSSKWVTAGRMGIWANSKPVYTETDVILIAGSNPPVSHQGFPMNPFPTTNLSGHIKLAKKQGTKIIVIDPRYTEMARQADIFVQPFPGHDAEIFAALIRLVLRNGWAEQSFCDRWTINLEALRQAVEPFTPEAVAASAGITAVEIETVARLLGEAKKPGIGTGTGVDMAAFSNTTEHLVEALTALVGGYIRAGDKIPNAGIFAPRPEEEMVIPPNRMWERGPRCVSDPTFGKLMGEFPASLFPDEVLYGGKDSIRALFVVGANPAMCLSEPDRVHAALDELDLLVTFDPRLNSATAQHAHYVIAPSLQFERSEATTFNEMVFHVPFIQYTPRAKAPPPGTMGEDEFFWLLAKHLGISLTLKNLPFGADFDDVPGGLPIDMETFPDRDQLIAWLVNQTSVPFDVVKAHPHGYQPTIDKTLQAPARDTGARLDLCPPDVAQEIGQVAHRLSKQQPFEYLLTSRRLLESFNSSFQGHANTQRRYGTNRLHIHPNDLAAIGAAEDQALRIRSEHGEVIGYARGDASMRPGAVSMSHCWGSGSQDDPLFLRGAHTGRLISMQTDIQTINRMPLQSGVRVRLEKLGFTLQEAKAGTVMNA